MEAAMEEAIDRTTRLVRASSLGDVRATDELIYARQATLMSKSTDGGRTWTSWNIQPDEGYSEDLQVLSDGTFVRVVLSKDEKSKDPVSVQQSRDEGRTWREIAEIDVKVPGSYQRRYKHWTMTKLPDDTLFLGIYNLEKEITRRKNIGESYAKEFNEEWWNAASTDDKEKALRDIGFGMSA